MMNVLLTVLFLSSGATPPAKPPKELEGSVSCHLKASQSGSQGVIISDKPLTSETTISNSAQMKLKFKYDPETSNPTFLSYKGYVLSESATINETGSNSVGLRVTVNGSEVVRRPAGEEAGSLGINYEAETYQVLPFWPDVNVVRTMSAHGEVSTTKEATSVAFGAVEVPLRPDGKISGTQTTKFLVTPATAMPFDGQLTCSWNVEMPREKDDKAQILVSGERCGCDPNDEVEVTAVTDAPGGKFDRFEVKTLSGQPPTIVSNTGAQQAGIRLKGDAQRTGEVELTAVWRKGSEVQKSAPFKVSFCALKKKPKLEETGAWLGGNKFSYSAGGEMIIDAKLEDAWLNGAPLKEVEWEITKSSAGAFESKSSGLSGRLISRKLPAKNDDFGERELLAKYEGGGCSCKSPPNKVKLFFPRDAKNNPEGKYPNWVFYWRQLDKLNGVLFTYADKLPPQLKCTSIHKPVEAPDDHAAAYYDYCVDTIRLGQKVLKLKGQRSGCIPRDGVNLVDGGLDCFVVILLHERRHQTDFITWWGHAMKNWSSDLDSDNDQVPDHIEKAYGCDIHEQQSCPSPPLPASLRDLKTGKPKVADNDLFTYASSWAEHSPGSLSHLDWACPGLQTKDDTDCGSYYEYPP